VVRPVAPQRAPIPLLRLISMWSITFPRGAATTCC
jgi:hypothetical protein